MLVLNVNARTGLELRVGGEVIRVVNLDRQRSKIGVDAPQSVVVLRDELAREERRNG